MIGAEIIIGHGVKIASELGVGTVVANICKAYIPEAASTATKVCVGVATMGISGAVGAAVDNWWDERIDDVKNLVDGIRAEKSENEAEPKTEEEIIEVIEVESIESEEEMAK